MITRRRFTQYLITSSVSNRIFLSLSPSFFFFLLSSSPPLPSGRGPEWSFFRSICYVLFKGSFIRINVSCFLGQDKTAKPKENRKKQANKKPSNIVHIFIYLYLYFQSRDVNWKFRMGW